MSKKTRIVLVVMLLMAIASIATGITMMFLDKNDAKESNKKEDVKEENKVPEKINYTNFSDSTDPNNLAIPLRWGSGHYVIKLNGEGLGNPFDKKYEKIETTSTYNFYNDSIKILSYFNASSDSEVRLYNLWGYGYISISVEQYNSQYIQGTTDYIEYTTIDSSNNYYLVENKWKSSDSVSYYIEIVNDNDMVEIYLGKINEVTAKEIFNSFVNNSEICYISIGEEKEIKKATKFEGSDETVDISNWTFIQNLMNEFYISRGIKVKNSTFIDGFNTTSYGLSAKNGIHLFPVFELDNQLYTAGITIIYLTDEQFADIIDKENWDSVDKKIYATLKTIEINKFKESYIYESSGEATLIVKTKEEKCYRIVTGITYKDESYTDEVISVINQLFY